MYRETVVHNCKKYHRYPESPRRQLRVYFWRHDKWKEPPFALHRQIWIDHNGDIPEGFIIHHKDDNPLNNNIENLEMLEKGAHSRKHMLTPKRREQSRKNGIKQTERIKKTLSKWREENPEKAKKIYSDNARKNFFLKEPKKAICPICKNSFESIYPRAKYCSNKCKNWYNNNRARKKKKSLQSASA